jgi:hypothetical protein
VPADAGIVPRCFSVAFGPARLHSALGHLSMGTLSTALRFVAMIGWCGLTLGSVAVGLSNFHEATAGDLGILVVLVILAGLSLTPHKYLLRSPTWFWLSVTVASLPFWFIAFKAATMYYGPGLSDVADDILIFAAFACPTLCLPLSLILRVSVIRRQTLAARLSQLGTAPHDGPAAPSSKPLVREGRHR